MTTKSKVQFPPGLLCALRKLSTFLPKRGSHLPIRAIVLSIVTAKADNYLHLVVTFSNYTEMGCVAVTGRY